MLIVLLSSAMALSAWPQRSRNSDKNPAEKPEETRAVFPEESFPRFIIEDLPKTPRLILGRGETEQNLLVSFLLGENKNADPAMVEELAGLYIREAQTEGINHDIAFAQMCLETGFLRFGGLVQAEMNNFCGLGSIGPGEPGEQFPSVQIGVRAHIQHLKAYATETPLAGELVDPRYRFVRRGSAPALQALAAYWAADKRYAEKIETILTRLYHFQETSLSSHQTGL
ncbi:hypothetical protein AGMMS50230_17910 [Spirochaetia bacterium]|nr:hypothetical protein AGMMS50230_17910 [Spirochaetia bacterium]